MRSRSGGAALQQVQILFDAGAIGMLTDAELLDHFVSRREDAVEAAFGALLRRHGPMVLGVCRGVLGDRPETEDAFQATFLVLVHRACTVRERDSLGRWLHGVARRIAVRAKTQAIRRRAHHQRFAEAAPTWQRLADDSSDEIAMLREEVERLPARFRAPVVLCYLEGLSYEGAARSLGVSEGTIRGRLARGRSLLQSRLERRGVTASAVLVALGARQARAVPTALADLTGRAAMRVAAGESASGVISASAASLLRGAIWSMNLSRWKTFAAGLLPVGVLCLGAGILVPRGSNAQPPAVATTQPAPAQSQEGTTRIDNALAELVPGRIVKSLDVTKDCMVLSYMPDWNFGNVDNLGVASNNGGVRTYMDWAAVPPQEANAPNRRFLLAVFSDKTTTATITTGAATADGRTGAAATTFGKTGSIFAFGVTEEWPERTSWKTQPSYEPEPAATFKFEPGDGWKLFDLTHLIQFYARTGKPGHGVVLRFLNEDRKGQDWSGYHFISREGERKSLHPRLLVVEPILVIEPAKR
jgi:RNA polymerase sigma factor (sigma-70 family)